MKRIYILFLVSLLLISCNKFIDVVPKGKTIPTSVDDLAKLMNSAQSSTQGLDLLSDDGYLSDIPNTWNSFIGAKKWLQNSCIWAPYIHELNEEDYNWNSFYKAIYILNYVIENIDNAPEGRMYNREEIKGRALTYRAFSYLILVNLYGQHYDVKTADTDLGVPLIIQSDINISYPRSTVAQVYAQIIADLEDALKLLKQDLGEYNHIPGRAAANGVLARTYLYMGDYDKSYNYVCEALQIKSTLHDMNLVEFNIPGNPSAGIINYETRITMNPEILFGYSFAGSWGYLSPDLQVIYGGEQDLRFRYFCTKKSRQRVYRLYY